MTPSAITIMTPGEHYREAQLLAERAAAVDMLCPDAGDREGCSRPDGLGGQCGHFLDAVEERDHLRGLAAIHAALAQCPPGTYTEADAVHRGETPPDAGTCKHPGCPNLGGIWRDCPEPAGLAAASTAQQAALADGQARIACALDLLAGPAWPAVDCGPSAAWSDLIDLAVRALTRDSYRHWVAAHPGWPGGEQSAPGADDVITVSAADLRAVVAAITTATYTEAAEQAGDRLRARIEGS